jgi:hypothetical protein
VCVCVCAVLFMKLQLSELHTNMSPQKEKLQVTRSQIITCFNNLSAVYYGLFPVGQTANFAFYIEVLGV